MRPRGRPQLARRCQANPAVATATNVPKPLFETLLEHSPQMRVVALSTDQVYDGNNCGGNYYTEESPQLQIRATCTVAPRWNWKTILLSLFPDNGIILRSSILLGPTAPFVEAHDTFLHFIASRTTKTTFYTNEIRSVLAVPDAVRIILKCCGLEEDNDKKEATNSSYSGGCLLHGGTRGGESVRHGGGRVGAFGPGQPPGIIGGAGPQAAPAHRKDAAGKATTVVQSPLNIAMDSSKLMAATGLSNKMMTLKEIVAVTFPPPIQNRDGITDNGGMNE